METQEFKIGDVVYLKSGSVKMTVRAVYHDKTAALYYWNEAKCSIQDTESIPIQCLVLAE